MKNNNQIEVDCEVCGGKVKKNTWAKHVKTENIGKKLKEEAVIQKLGGIWRGQRAGRSA